MAELTARLCARCADLSSTANREWIHGLGFLCLWANDDHRWLFGIEISIRLRSASHLQYLRQQAATPNCESQWPFYIWQRYATARFLSALFRGVCAPPASKTV